MAQIPNRPPSQNKYPEQYMQNTSFDEDFGVNAVEALVYNPVTGSLDRMVQSGQTLPTAGTNGILKLSYNASGQLVYITETIAGVDYRETVSGTGTYLITDYVVTSTQIIGASVQQ